jgi:hypothetical protein
MVSKTLVSIAAFHSTQLRSECIKEHVDRVVQLTPLRAQTPACYQLSECMFRTIDSGFGESRCIGLPAVSMHSKKSNGSRARPVKYSTDLGHFYFDNLYETFVNVYVSSNYFRSGGRHFAFPGSVRVGSCRPATSIVSAIKALPGCA